MVNLGGTGSPARVISATPAPLPPSRSRIEALPSSKEYTHFAVRGRRAAAAAFFFGTLVAAARRVAVAVCAVTAALAAGFAAFALLDLEVVRTAMASSYLPLRRWQGCCDGAGA